MAVHISIKDIEAALQRDWDQAILSGWGPRQQAKYGGLLFLAQDRITDVGDVRMLMDDALDQMVAGYKAETPVEIGE